MKKLLHAATITAVLTGLVVLSGCQQLKETAQTLRTEGEKTINDLSQQVDTAKNKIIETKMAIELKSQQVVNATDAVNKLTH